MTSAAGNPPVTRVPVRGAKNVPATKKGIFGIHPGGKIDTQAFRDELCEDNTLLIRQTIDG